MSLAIDKQNLESLDDVRQAIADFAQARDWEQFHSPKNLIMALSVEVAELMEHFQWLTLEGASQLDETRLAEVADEIADVQIYLARLADRLGIDILAACTDKMVKNAEKYPITQAAGIARNHTDFK